MVLAALAMMGLASCMGKDGDKATEPVEYVAKDRSFELSFSDPPWRIVEESDQGVRLQVDSEIFGVSLGDSVPPMHILLASPVRLDQHLNDLIDPDELGNFLEQAGVDKDKIPTNFDTIDTNALGSLTNTNFSSMVGSQGPRPSGSTSTTFSGFPEGMTLPGGQGVGRTGDSSGDQVPDPGQNPKVPKIPEYLEGVDLHNARDVAVAELNFLVRENKARIVDGLQYFHTRQGLFAVTYQLAMTQGVFVRNLYVPTKNFTLRVGIMSLYELSNEDIHRLLISVKTDLDPVQSLASGKDVR